MLVNWITATIIWKTGAKAFILHKHFNLKMKKKKVVKSIAFISVALLLLFFLYKGIKYLLPYNLEKDQFQTSQVDRGTVMTFIDAEGIVEPENEVLLLSPATSIIHDIINESGSRVKAGEVILRLDPKPVEDNLNKLREDLEIRDNNLTRVRLNAKDVKLELDYNVEMKKLKIASIKSNLEDEKQLLEVGGISSAKIDKTKQELVFAEKDLEMVLQKNSIRLRQLEVEEEGLLLQIKSLTRNINEQNKLLQRMLVKAPSDGIVLNVYGKEGEKINQDKLIVRMSDLSSFKITGFIDGDHAENIKTGGEVYAIVDKTWISGQIGTIRPLIEDNKIQFDVFLRDSNSPRLISNLNVPLKLVRKHKNDVLRITNGPAFNDSRYQQVFMVEKDKAVKKEIEFGLRGQDYFEIREGAVPGDEIIISDVSSFKMMKEVEIHDE